MHLPQLTHSSSSQSIFQLDSGKTRREPALYRPFYRPYYVAFYGEMKMGKKVRYIAIEADGYKTDSSL